jgi:two-component system sensor kinase FixL
VTANARTSSTSSTTTVFWPARSRTRSVADLKAVLDQLCVVIEPDWDEIGGRVIWQMAEPMPPVAANAHGLLQIFLNLCQNSLRAVEGRPDRRLTISACVEADDMVLTFSDSGPGVANPETLFHLHPLRSQTEGTGLGLYISRELARSVGGDLRYVPSASGAQFRVVIPLARVAATTGERRAS